LTTSGGVQSAGGALQKKLCGTWRLVSYRRTVVETGETHDFFGRSPCGLLNYSPDGRMSVIVVKQERPRPAEPSRMTDRDRLELFQSMVSYAGTYTFDGKTVTHHVEISWNELWTGTDQIRNARIEGRRLILSTDPFTDPADGKQIAAVLVWERIE
jgi:hypothetical protein